MKLECKIKRDGGTKVDLTDEAGVTTEIHFKPLDPSQPVSPHVAEVTASQAQRFFIADPRVYVPFEAKAAPKLDKPPAKPPAPPADDDGEAGEDAAQMTVAELEAGIKDGSLTPERLRELLEDEQQSEKPRSTFIDTIVKSLK